MNLSDSVYTALLSSGVAAGTTTATISGVNASPFDVVLITVVFGTISAGAVTTVKLQHSTDNSSWSDVAGSLITVLDSQSDRLVGYNIQNPGKAYIRPVVVRSVANAAISSAFAQGFGSRKMPVSNASNVVAMVNLTEMVDGTP